MYTLILLLGFLGFFFLYSTSKKIKFSSDGKCEKWLQSNPRRSKQIGLALIIISFILFIWKDGVGVGVFSALLVLMTAASMIISITPLNYFKLKHISGLVIISLILELLIF